MRLDPELTKGMYYGLLAGVAVLVLVLPPKPQPTAVVPARSVHAVAVPSPRPPTTAPTVVERRLDFAGQASSPPARQLAEWIVGSGDNGSLPFAIVDKKGARVYVFAPEGHLQGATPVLLGYAAGDDSVAGIGQRPIADVRPEERTTPAGRFVSAPGRNALNEEVVWVDYDAAVSMHRVRLTDPKERRAERLASPSARDNRISYGCINMPKAFFETVLWPSFGKQAGVIYVLPETKSLAEVFPALRQPLAHAAAAPVS
jgi:hypothetical protein